jgi:diaminopimelate epimerase
VEALQRLLAVDDALVSATLVDVGNPHCVLQVSSVVDAPVATLGPRLERHPAFPRGSNIEFLALRGPHEADLHGRGGHRGHGAGSRAVAHGVAPARRHPACRAAPRWRGALDGSRARAATRLTAAGSTSGSSPRAAGLRVAAR